MSSPEVQGREGESLGWFRKEEFRAFRANPFMYRQGRNWCVERVSDRRLIAQGLERRWAQRIASALSGQPMYIPLPDLGLDWEWEG
jgi:hypothetical protein